MANKKSTTFNKIAKAMKKIITKKFYIYLKICKQHEL